jgi:hypothetical protein
VPHAAGHALIGYLVAATLARRRRRFGALAALCAPLLTSKLARAQAQEPTLLVYRAAADCPAVGDFQRSVERRSARIHFVDEGSHARELSIFLRKEGDLTIGELRLIEENGNLRQRSVRFPSCADAVEGLALIATVSLDPQALLENPAPVPEKPPEPPPRPPAPPPPAPVASPKPPPKRGAVASALEVGLGAEANAFFHAFPQTAFGGSAFVDVGSSSRHWFAPEFRGALTYVQRNGVLGDIEDGTADVKLALLTVFGCPLKIGEKTVIFRPCAFVSGGGLHTRGTSMKLNTATTHPQISWGGSALLAVHVVEHFEIVGDASVGVNAIRDHFGFTGGPTPFATAWSTPAVYLSTGLGFRLLLP